MTTYQAQKALYDLIKSFFVDADVSTANQSHKPKPKNPLVTLFFGQVERPENPCMRMVRGEQISFYPSKMPVQIDLFTNGRKVSLGEGITPIRENTALEDMTQFVAFLNSPYTIQYCQKHDMAIVMLNNVRDLTGLINDAEFEYRAMIEIELRYTSNYYGHKQLSSLDGNLINSSGGGLSGSGGGSSSGNSSSEGSEDVGEYFENVEINDKLMKEE